MNEKNEENVKWLGFQVTGCRNGEKHFSRW